MRIPVIVPGWLRRPWQAREVASPSKSSLVGLRDDVAQASLASGVNFYPEINNMHRRPSVHVVNHGGSESSRSIKASWTSTFILDAHLQIYESTYL